ncbi:hypothetical protein F5Y17DRAFT_460208 [Xylariaceae sp. FL0594]|nr:hypothetical protein F5Y17DRAFT_460208 [Xylariaceae sp. FL0594]
MVREVKEYGVQTPLALHVASYIHAEACWSGICRVQTPPDIHGANPSVISSEGAIGKQFNPQGPIGKIGEKIGGPLSSEGMIGKQFDASKDGIAGHVERAVDGPRNPSGSSRS